MIRMNIFMITLREKQPTNEKEKLIKHVKALLLDERYNFTIPHCF